MKYDDLEDNADTKVKALFQPKGVQIEALYVQEDSRSEGVVKGLIQTAAGDGGIIVPSQAKAA